VFDHCEYLSRPSTTDSLTNLQSAERSLDTSLEISHDSPCWKFFHAFNTQSMGPARKEQPDLALFSDLARSLEGLSIFLHEIRPASEALICFAEVSSLIRECQSHWRQSCNSFASSTTGPRVIPEGAYSQETSRALLRSVRIYGASLTLGLLMITIVRMYMPDQEHALAQTSCVFTDELITLAKQATQFKPLGAAFMLPFLHTVWAIGDHDSRTALTSAFQLHGIDFDGKHATYLSIRLDDILQDLRSRILAQSPHTISSSTTPLPELPYESTELHQDVHLTDHWYMYDTTT